MSSSGIASYYIYQIVSGYIYFTYIFLFNQRKLLSKVFKIGILSFQERFGNFLKDTSGVRRVSRTQTKVYICMLFLLAHAAFLKTPCTFTSLYSFFILEYSFHFYLFHSFLRPIYNVICSEYFLYFSHEIFSSLCSSILFIDPHNIRNYSRDICVHFLDSYGNVRSGGQKPC